MALHTWDLRSSRFCSAAPRGLARSLNPSAASSAQRQKEGRVCQSWCSRAATRTALSTSPCSPRDAASCPHLLASGKSSRAQNESDAPDTFFFSTYTSHEFASPPPVTAPSMFRGMASSTASGPSDLTATPTQSCTASVHSFSSPAAMRPSSARDFDRRRPPFLPKAKHSLPRSWKAWFQLSWYGTVTMASTPATTRRRGWAWPASAAAAAPATAPSSTHASINSARTLHILILNASESFRLK
mmetsp:Transcript_8744/g.31530  ORF Transcript_8744/g.31530 Transcript_8744/m.31530 type:complete len:243 (-) Transcript_8744:1361-2089(-)